MKVWDLLNHRVLKNWEFHNDSIFSLSVSDNFTKIVTGGRNGEIFLTDLAKGVYTKVDNVRDQITSVAIKTSGEFAIYASSAGNKLYEYVNLVKLVFEEETNLNKKNRN
jgi:WD40 repeat protein